MNGVSNQQSGASKECARVVVGIIGVIFVVSHTFLYHANVSFL